MERIVIALDNGHGLNTAGKRTPVFPKGGVIREWQFNYPTVKRLGRVLKRCGFIVVYTSDTEEDTSLSQRAKVANENGASAFVSVHYNAFKSVWGTHGGIETFHYPTSSNGKRLAAFVQNQMWYFTKLRNRGVKSANFQVLRETAMPSILCECGFMDNLEEASKMLDENYQELVAMSIAKGLCEYFNVPFVDEPVEVKPVEEAKGLYKVQVGAYRDRGNAENTLKALKEKGFEGYIKID